jgi:DNA repair protein RadC
MNIPVRNKNMVIQGSGDIYDLMRTVLKRDIKTLNTREYFWAIALDAARRVINIEQVSSGGIAEVMATPMEILNIPLQKKASYVILVHNHPSGNLEPSTEDQERTDCIIQAARLLNIKVKDHLIISEHSYYSFYDSELLNELEESTKYMPPYKIEEMIRKDLLLDAKLDICGRMLRAGERLEKIMEFTGLSLSQIKGVKRQMNEFRLKHYEFKGLNRRASV